MNVILWRLDEEEMHLQEMSLNEGNWIISREEEEGMINTGGDERNEERSREGWPNRLDDGTGQ